MEVFDVFAFLALQYVFVFSIIVVVALFDRVKIISVLLHFKKALVI